MMNVSDLERFAEGVALHNRLVDEDAAQKEMKMITKYSREIWRKEHGKSDLAKKATNSVSKVADKSWMTKENMMAKWKAIKEESAKKEKESTNTITPKMSESRDALQTVDAKILETMNHPKEKEQQRPTVITRGVTPMAKSEAPIISQKITKQQQNAFHEDYASKLGITQSNSRANANSKGYQR